MVRLGDVSGVVVVVYLYVMCDCSVVSLVMWGVYYCVVCFWWEWVSFRLMIYYLCDIKYN